jgi:hypothetical protein
MFPIDLLADLPEPRDDEPSSLRSDIFDELADHLQCAFRREVLKDGDAEAAQRRVLDRFGDPKQLARRLWRQAMWSRIMRQRMVSGLQWMVALTAMLLAGAVFWQQSRMFAELRRARHEDAAERQALAAMLDQLQLRAEAAPPIGTDADNVSVTTPSAAAADRETLPDVPPQPVLQAPNDQSTRIDNGPPILTLTFVQETEDGPPVVPALVMMVSSGGEAVGMESLATIHSEGTTKTDKAAGPSAIHNKVVARSLEPDLYELTVQLDDGQQSARPVSIRDDKPRELTILCPAQRKKTPVSIAIQPLPEKLQKRNFDVSLHVLAAPAELGQGKWTAVNLPSYKIAFDEQTGLPAAIDTVSPVGRHIDLQDLPAEERRVFLPVGVVRFRFETSERTQGPGSVRVYYWPVDSFVAHTLEAGENRWELELPPEYLEQLLASPAGNPYEAAPAQPYRAE